MWLKADSIWQRSYSIMKTFKCPLIICPTCLINCYYKSSLNFPFSFFPHGGRFYAIVVVRSGEPASDPNVYLDAGVYTSGVAYYIAAAWDSNGISSVPDTFTVGDGTTTTANNVTYVNVGLDQNTQYAIFTRIEIESDTNQVS